MVKRYQSYLTSKDRSGCRGEGRAITVDSMLLQWEGGGRVKIAVTEVEDGSGSNQYSCIF